MVVVGEDITFYFIYILLYAVHGNLGELTVSLGKLRFKVREYS